MFVVCFSLLLLMLKAIVSRDVYLGCIYGFLHLSIYTLYYQQQIQAYIHMHYNEIHHMHTIPLLL